MEKRQGDQNDYRPGRYIDWAPLAGFCARAPAKLQRLLPLFPSVNLDLSATGLARSDVGHARHHHGKSDRNASRRQPYLDNHQFSFV